MPSHCLGYCKLCHRFINKKVSWQPTVFMLSGGLHQSIPMAVRSKQYFEHSMVVIVQCSPSSSCWLNLTYTTWHHIWKSEISVNTDVVQCMILRNTYILNPLSLFSLLFKLQGFLTWNLSVLMFEVHTLIHRYLTNTFLLQVLWSRLKFFSCPTLSLIMRWSEVPTYISSTGPWLPLFTECIQFMPILFLSLLSIFQNCIYAYTQYSHLACFPCPLQPPLPFWASIPLEQVVV